MEESRSGKKKLFPSSLLLSLSSSFSLTLFLLPRKFFEDENGRKEEKRINAKNDEDGEKERKKKEREKDRKIERQRKNRIKRFKLITAFIQNEGFVFERNNIVFSLSSCATLLLYSNEGFSFFFSFSLFFYIILTCLFLDSVLECLNE